MSEREMPYEVVTTNERLIELLALHAGEDRYAFDTEFDNRRTYYARLALVQIAWPSFIMLVDPFSVDVRLLEPLFNSDATAIAHAAINDLTALGRVTAFDEECDAVLATTARETNPQQSWWNLHNREQIPRDDLLVVQYLAAVREELAEMLNITRRYLVSDETLIAMGAARPRTTQAVGRMLGRRVDESFVGQFLQAIVDAEAGQGPALELPGDERGDDLRALVSVLQALVWQTATAMSLEPSFLASKNDILARLAGRPSKLDRGWRNEVITALIDAVTDGSFAVAWRDGALQLVELPD